jgi:hypothetical protein
MSVPAARKGKPKAADEAARVLRIYDWLTDELDKRHVGDPDLSISHDTAASVLVAGRSAILAVAERIAARTED